MFAENLIQLRKLNKLTQEELAEKLGVSRQTIAKWESGESLPDLERSRQLSQYFDISLDELAGESLSAPIKPSPKGKFFFGLVKVGDKGQIVIPARARRVFNIKQGDNFICLGDEDRGIALIPEKDMLHLISMARSHREEEE